jgi:solute carrier family 25 carnitine/acylcarnitine transporter 20/29
LARKSLEEEGLKSFYGGVESTMIGQAIIKGSTFWAYDFTQTFLATSVFHVSELGAGGLALAAMVSGFVSAFIVTPVERIKCVMQAAKTNQFSSPLACTQEVVRTDGLSGLFGRGLLITLLREVRDPLNLCAAIKVIAHCWDAPLEFLALLLALSFKCSTQVPSYAFYFSAYEFTSATLLDAIATASCSLPTWLPSLVPLVGGAAAGVAAWVPVYPIDVVKTNLQVILTRGDRSFE